MAHPSITIAGATFQTVPSIVVPKAGGGDAVFYDMSDDMSFLGKDVELVNASLYSSSFALEDTAFNGWTPSTTAKTCIATATAGTFAQSDMEDNEYFILWECGVDVVYGEGTTNKAKTLFSRAAIAQELFRRPSTWANIGSEIFNGNACSTVFSQNFLRYYGTTAGTITYTWNVSYGFYFGATAATFSPTTGNGNVTVKTPIMSARCSTTYLSTGNAGLIDQENSKGFIKGKLYRIKRDGFHRGMHNLLVKMING